MEIRNGTIWGIGMVISVITVVLDQSRENRVVGPKIVQEKSNKLRKITDKLSSTRSGQKSYADNRRRIRNLKLGIEFS